LFVIAAIIGSVNGVVRFFAASVYVREKFLPPSRWYLTGFLVPVDADENEKTDEAGIDELDTVNDAKGLDDAVAPEPGAARRSFFPSSVGLSFLTPAPPP
jgi:hypothetical protein